MTPLEKAEALAHDRAVAWLRAHGYTQFRDGTWAYEGCEADLLEALMLYIVEMK